MPALGLASARRRVLAPMMAHGDRVTPELARHIIRAYTWCDATAVLTLPPSPAGRPDRPSTSTRRAVAVAAAVGAFVLLTLAAIGAFSSQASERGSVTPTTAAPVASTACPGAPGRRQRHLAEGGVAAARLVPIAADFAGHGAQLFPLCHGRAWPSHPRLAVLQQGKSWMAGIKPAMTQWARPCHRPAILTPMPDKPGHDEEGKIRLWPSP